MEWTKVTPLARGCTYYEFDGLFESSSFQRIRMVKFQQRVNSNLSLVPSKASAAIRPASSTHVHSGPEASFEQILSCQPGIRMMCNGTFHHFSKTLYSRSSFGRDFERGDNVHYSSYRGWSVGDKKSKLEQEAFRYAILSQKHPGHPFHLSRSAIDDSSDNLYDITCSPMLVFETRPIRLDQVLSDNEMVAHETTSTESMILPPGNLQHLRVRNARTMIIETVDENLLFITIDGPPKNKEFISSDTRIAAAGMDFEEQVRFCMKLKDDLKVKHAANLDGGGSTTMYVDQNNTIEGIVNQPADPGRAIGNTLILFDHSLLDVTTLQISDEHRKQILRAHAKYVIGFNNYS